MHLSRRALFRVVLPATTLLMVDQPLRARATPQPDAGPANRAVLVSNTVAIFAGTTDSNARPEVGAKLTSIASTARARLTAMGNARQGELFEGVPLGVSDTNLTSSFRYLYEIALATRAPGLAEPGLHDDQTVQRRVIDGLTRLHDDFYGAHQQRYYRNWFNWEIGISSHVSKILVLLKDQLAAYAPGLTTAYIASMDAYLRKGKDGDVDLTSRFHTGANLADITTNRILQGAVMGDDTRIRKAIADQLTVVAPVDPYRPKNGVSDGFYADGSFIQHACVAYTGSYGKNLLTRVVQTIKTLEGTDYGQVDSFIGILQGWLVNGFAPLIFEGWMMEIVKGRGVSRTTSGYTDTVAVIEAVVDLCGHATGADATALKSYVKFLRQTSKAAPDPAVFVSPVSIAHHADILADHSTPAADLIPNEASIAFNAMDRAVHRRPGYAFALARSSTRISKYEYMSGENLMPWFQGDGAHYLYLSGQDQSQAFGVDYYTAVSPYCLAGVTAPVEIRRTIPELYGTAWYDNPERGFTPDSESQNTYVYLPRGTNTFSGGASLGTYGVAGLTQADDTAYRAKQAGVLPDGFVAYRNATATKSWFMFDHEIVVLTSGAGDPAGRAVTTTVDSRISDPSEPITLTGELLGGKPWSGTGTAPLAWLRYANATQHAAVGYVLLDGPQPTVTLGTTTHSRRIVRQTNPAAPVTKNVFSIFIEQKAATPLTTMAHVLVPNASERQMKSYYGGGPLSILVNTTRVQAVEHTGLHILAANAFTPGTHHAGQLSIDGPASVILRRAPGGTTSIAVSDPTMEREAISVTLRGPEMRALSADDGVRIGPVPGGTRIDITTGHAYGRSFTATLHHPADTTFDRCRSQALG